ncbi:MAG: HpcH/HpaI aldolase/citrate lyase family protein, partial [Clostridiaceae bacterium]|nr:HpcH/HpaI aldolase/citrate lyase family protein [Clostridiaceae bacterium]
MRHHKYNSGFKFVLEPEDFNKYTEKELLQYCPGATMYMPGVNDFSSKILNKQMPGLTSLVFDFEDACPHDRVEEAEANVLSMLDIFAAALDEQKISYDDLPLVFCRVRNHDQFIRFADKLTKQQAKVLAGINFPKFNSQNGEVYMFYLKKLNEKLDEIIYGMPIIEDSRVAYKETRMSELLSIKHILDSNKNLILQVRVGATDFSSF